MDRFRDQTRDMNLGQAVAQDDKLIRSCPKDQDKNFNWDLIIVQKSGISSLQRWILY